MVAIVRTEWSGTSGGPGLTQTAVLGGAEFTAGNAQAAVNAVRAFWFSLAASLPDELKLQVSPIVDTYNDATGELVGSSVAPVIPGGVVGTNSLGYVGGAGAKVTWNTGTIRNGRRVRGSTFIVPLANSVFSNIGTVGQTFQNSTNTAASQLIAALSSGGCPMLIWSRPLVKDDVMVRTGVTTGVISGACSTKSAILRGRRD